MDNENNKQRLSVKRLCLLGGAIIIIIAIALAVLVVTNRKQTEEYSLVVKTVNSDMANKDYKAAADLINKQSYSSQPKMQRLLAGVYVSWGEPSKALTIYNDLKNSHQLTASDAENAGSAAAILHDYSLAYSYYNDAANLSRPDHSSPVSGTEATYDLQQANKYAGLVK